MKDIPRVIIKVIAHELDCGNDCYYNIKTHEIFPVPTFNRYDDDELFEDIYGEELKIIKQNKKDYIKFEPLESFESFKIMERFANQINDEKLKTELENILQKRKPFQNFKHAIDHSDYRQEWFDFKQTQIEKIVSDRIQVE